MDNTDIKKKIVLRKRVRNPDGSVTVTTKPKLRKKRKVVIARGKGEHTIGNVIASQLQPFKSFMKAGLRKRGYNTSGVPFKDIISLYYNEFASNQENKVNGLVPLNRYEFRNNPAWKIRPSDNLNGDINDYKNLEYFTEVNSVVDNIISVFRESKLAMQEAIFSGVNPKTVLTDEEIEQAKAASKVETQLENKIFNAQPVRWSEFKQVLKIVLIIWLIYYFIR